MGQDAGVKSKFSVSDRFSRLLELSKENTLSLVSALEDGY